MTVLATSAGPAVAGGRAAGDGSRPGGIPPALWAALLDDAEARARVHEKVYRRGPGQCHYWLGAVSSSGHGRVRVRVKAASAPRPASVMVAPHVYLYQESRGLLRPLPDGSYPLIRHRCGEASCLNPIHLAAGTAPDHAGGPFRVPDGHGFVQAELDGFGVDRLSRRPRVTLDETVQRMKRDRGQAKGQKRGQHQQY